MIEICENIRITPLACAKDEGYESSILCHFNRLLHWFTGSLGCKVTIIVIVLLMK